MGTPPRACRMSRCWLVKGGGHRTGVCDQEDSTGQGYREDRRSFHGGRGEDSAPVPAPAPGRCPRVRALQSDASQVALPPGPQGPHPLAQGWSQASPGVMGREEEQWCRERVRHRVWNQEGHKERWVVGPGIEPAVQVRALGQNSNLRPLGAGTEAITTKLYLPGPRGAF